eukprot:TRINITY_DN7849_c0_g1_i2.p1 TRINITY_DN7849_c0_g1~~TRINITY_DN7849_c0_g1_i2.p1  ORF type:complete len:1236 (+),score=344.66 TRINITY_DN7849_c0_g1_i2:80-3709(+)
MLLHLRPLIALSSVVTTAIALAGGLYLYQRSKDSLQSLYEQQQQQLEFGFNASVSALRAATDQAERTLLVDLEARSSTDIRLFGGALRQSFLSVEEQAESTLSRFELNAGRYTSLQQLRWMTFGDHCGALQASLDKDWARVSGVGIQVVDTWAATDDTFYSDNPAVRSTYRFIDTFCWWDAAPEPAAEWYGTVEQTWDSEHGWVSPYYSVQVPSLQIDFSDFVDGEQAALGALSFDNVSAAAAASWSEPSTWWTEAGSIALYVYLEAYRKITVLPLNATLGGNLTVLVTVETDLSHWGPLVRDFADKSRSNSSGPSLFVFEPHYSVVLAHTAEPMPPMWEDEACQEGESTGVGGLGEADSSACFPLLLNYSSVTQFIAGAAIGAPHDTLFNGTMCHCNGSRVNCSAADKSDGHCPDGSAVQREVYWIRKQHLWDAGSFEFDVAWYVAAVEVSGELRRQRDANIRQIEEGMKQLVVAQEQIKAQVDSDVESSVWALVGFIAASFLCSVLLGFLWITLVALPLTDLEASLLLLGDVQCDEALERWRSRRARSCGNVEVREIAELGRGLEESAAVLREYRSFLPVAVLPQRDTEQECVSVEPPRGAAAICFTDIVGSTKLWQAAPESMNAALELHNDVVRRCMQQHTGYEVKTIGDSFMGAWADPAGAVRFGVQVQEQLLDADWPEEPSFAMVHDKWATQVDQAGRLLWNGITVRIGISWGQVMEEVNPMTLRLDYRGPVVNLAARLESSAPHGSVHVSGGLYDELSGDQRLSNIEFTALGQVELKGLGAHTTYLASSQRLRGRVEYALQSTLSADRTRARSASRVFGDSAATSQLFKSSLWAANPLRRTSSKSVGSSGGSTVDESPRNSTRCNSSSSLGARRRRPGGTAQGMQTALASVAVVTDQLQSNAGQPRPLDGHSHGHSYHRDDVSDDPSNVTRWVVDCTTAAARTQGQVTTVMGPAAQVTWNAVGPPCPNHRAQLLLFMVVVNMGEGSAKSIAVGAGSGELLHGNTGFASQRFSIVAGLVPQLAHVLSATAAELGAPALAAFLPRLPPPLVPLTRPVDCWRVSMRDRATPVYILQPLLDLIGGRNAMELDGSSSMEQSMRRAHDLRGPRVHEAYDAVLQRADEEALGLFREAASSGADPVLSQVVLTLEEHVRTHPSGAQTRIPAPFVSPSGRLPSGAPARTQSPPQGARSVDRTASPLVLETAY